MPPRDQRPRYLTDPEELKALTHPLRQRMLARLRNRGPATSAELATEFSEDRGATSYHLRQLAKYGYLEVDTTLSSGRRKYWRAIPLDLRLPEPDSVDEPARAAAQEVGRQWMESGIDALARHWKERGADPDWDAAATIATSVTRLTREELERFNEEYLALVKRWSRTPEEASPDAQPVTALFGAFRTPRDQQSPGEPRAPRSRR
ncbi:MAG: helix-turn-helix domain-containing protein [Micromonosporaceae bacterium]